MNDVNNVIMYLANADGYKIINDVYGEGLHETYVQEKMCIIRDVSRFWAALDIEHRARLVNAANAYYGS